MLLNTLNTIIDDIFNEIRSNNIAESESLSRNQVEQWIVQYRAVLIKQDIDKGRDINPDYIQYINAIPMEMVDFSEGYSTNNRFVSQTTVDIPKAIDFHFTTGLVSITDLAGNIIQLGTETIANAQSNRRYTSNDYIAYKKGNKIRVSGPNELEKINVGVIAENPSDADTTFSADDLYPIPVNMITVLKDMIINKEIRRGFVSDNTNDGKDDIENAYLNRNNK